MKLINDSDVFQKERPTTITNEQRMEVLKEVAVDIVNWQLCKSSLGQIIADLDEVYDSSSSGFEMAKELEEGFNIFGYYTVNSQLVELLENLDSLSDDKKRDNIKDWVKAHNIKPKFKKGDKVKLKLAPFFSLNVGDEVYINYIKEDTAHYVVDKDPNRKGGIVVEYEKLERCI